MAKSWTNPLGYMNVDRVGPVEIMTPKARAGMDGKTVRVAVSPDDWLRLFRGSRP